jgi:ADP-ribosylglycohydrolase
VKLTERELDRGRGAWLGQIVGDALGTTVEFRPASSIEREYPNGLREIVGGGPFRVLPGQVTDDTELALALARSIIEHGGYDADRVAYAYLAWYRSGPFDVGGTTSQAFGGAVEPGRAAAELLTRRANRKSESNGSLMRASPLGIYGWRLPEIELADLAATDSSLSHPAAACVAACLVHTYAIAYAIRTGHKPIAVYEEALDFARRSARPAVVVLEEAARGLPDDFYVQQGWVWKAFKNAFYELLDGPSFEESLVRTVSRGGDTDTNACIAGALLGAVHGEQAIPERWRRTVLACRTPRGPTYQTTDAREIAVALLEMGDDVPR